MRIFDYFAISILRCAKEYFHARLCADALSLLRRCAFMPCSAVSLSDILHVDACAFIDFRSLRDGMILL